MFQLTLDDHASPTRTATHRVIRLIRLALRRARRRSERERILRQILNETSDPHVLADIGVTPPGQSLLERFPLAFIDLHH